MGKRGPAKTPTAVLERRGSWRAKTRKGEPEPTTCELTPPAWLEGEGLTLWADLVPELVRCGIAKRTDRLTLAMLCDTYAAWREEKRTVAEHGLTDSTTNGNTVQRVEVGQMNRDRDVLIKLAKEFGLTAASRAGVDATPEGPANSKDRFFKIVG